jgi:hypothetical protein
MTLYIIVDIKCLLRLTLYKYTYIHFSIPDYRLLDSIMRVHYIVIALLSEYLEIFRSDTNFLAVRYLLHGEVKSPITVFAKKFLRQRYKIRWREHKRNGGFTSEP